MRNYLMKTRQKLIGEGNLKRYLIFAIGEALLVTIGILLALQVDNWNELKKEKFEEKEVYENLLSTLKRDSSELVYILSIQNKSLEKQRLVIQSNFSILKDSMSVEEINQLLLDICNGIFSFFPKYGTYNSILSNNGLDIIKSNEIKTLTIDLYDYECQRYENMDKIIDHKFQFELIPFMNRELDFFWNGKGISNKVNMELLERKYNELILVCRDEYGVLSNGIDALIDLQKSINKLIILINEELK
jgi:hypothetical protein